MLTPLIRLYRWIRFRHGHGVHSPFAFTFINDVVEEKSAFYGYKEIADKLILRRNIGEDYPNYKLKNNLLFFRISHFYNIRKALICGIDSPSSILYFQGSSSSTECIYFDSDQKKIDSALTLADDNHLFRIIETPVEKLLEAVEKVQINGEAADLLYIHQDIPDEIKQKLIDYCSNLRNHQLIVIFDNIRSSKAITSFWEHLKLNKSYQISFDLINLGVIVVNSKLNKQNYKLYF